ncbi:MBL fold metallo-hydrolase [Streptomyces sp. BSE7F]|nr:MBL fold metallo-hydrolase [Streptomyces sp. BSE7F]
MPRDVVPASVPVMTVTWEESGWEQLAPEVGRRRLPGWDCTAGLVLGAEGVLAVDAGSSLAEGARLRTEARELTGRRVTHLALTHPHFDHVLGAPAFADAEVYGAVGLDVALAGRGGRSCGRTRCAGVSTRRRPTRRWRLWSRPAHGVRRVDAGPGRRTPGAAGERGSRSHRVRPGGAGARRPGVVFCGDLVEESDEPQAGPDAVPSRWPAALDRLLRLGGEDAVYVPGHGAVVDAAFVRAQRDALAARFGVSE